jgi:hypothetical protein
MYAAKLRVVHAQGLTITSTDDEGNSAAFLFAPGVNQCAWAPLLTTRSTIAVADMLARRYVIAGRVADRWRLIARHAFCPAAIERRWSAAIDESTE